MTVFACLIAICATTEKLTCVNEEKLNGSIKNELDGHIENGNHIMWPSEHKLYHTSHVFYWSSRL